MGCANFAKKNKFPQKRRINGLVVGSVRSLQQNVYWEAEHTFIVSCRRPRLFSHRCLYKWGRDHAQDLVNDVIRYSSCTCRACRISQCL